MSGRERAAARPCGEALKDTGGGEERKGRGREEGGGCQVAGPLCNLTSGLHPQPMAGASRPDPPSRRSDLEGPSRSPRLRSRRRDAGAQGEEG